MNETPWSVVQASITRLSDRMNALPTIREATVAAAEPLAVLFDTDTEPVFVYGTLVSGLAAGNRVLTVKLRHYIWVVGLRGGPTWGNISGKPVVFPSSFSALGQLVEIGSSQNLNDYITNGEFYQEQSADAQSGANYPVGVAGHLLVRATEDGKFVQQWYTAYKDYPGIYWRGFYNGGWGAWESVSGVGDTGYITINYASGFNTSGGSPVAVRLEGHHVKMRGEGVRTGNFAANTLYVIGTLPNSTFWPKEWAYFSTGGSNVTIGVQVVILNNGDVRVVTGNGGFSYIEFSGLSWDVDQ